MKACRKNRKRLEWFFEGELSVEERFALEDHLDSCSECSRDFEGQILLEETLHQLPDPKGDLPLADSLEKIHAAIDAPAFRRKAPGLSRIAAVAATLVLAGLGFWFAQNLSQDRIAEQTQSILSRGGDVLIPERLQETKDLLQRGLLESFQPIYGSSPREEIVRAAHQFDQMARPYRQNHWPVLRIVEGFLQDEDVPTILASLRYLGIAGDRLSLTKIRQLLGRKELARTAVRALGDSGKVALPALVEALDQVEVQELALAKIRAIGGVPAADALEYALTRETKKTPKKRNPVWKNRLLSSLSELGPGALPGLLRLGNHPEIFGPGWLRSLTEMAGGQEALDQLLREGGLEFKTPTLLAAVEQLHPPAGLPWLEELCREGRHQESALEILAGYPGVESLDVFLRLAAGGHIEEKELPAVRLAMVNENSRNLATHARGVVEAKDVSGAQRFVRVLGEVRRPETAPALALLASSEVLPTEERRRIALLVGETGLGPESRPLEAAFARLAPDQEKLGAAYLLSIYSLAGEKRVRDSLGKIPKRSGERIVQLLEKVSRSHTKTSSVFKVARELKPVLLARKN